MIAIVDYGMGNLRSVQKAFERLGVAATICPRPEELASATKLILPGVGAFRDAMAELDRRGFVQPIREHLAAEQPFLGICLGLQLLFDVSFEEGQWQGLKVLPGRVVRFDNAPGLKIPHMGWNRIEQADPAASDGAARLLAGIPADAHFYFVHSYVVEPADQSVVVARTVHGQQFVSMIARGNLFATQFHPEKSQRAGLKLLENFAAL